MRPPRPRGPLTDALLEDLTGRRSVSARTLSAAAGALGAGGPDAALDEDVQLRRLLDAADGPSPSRHLQHRGTLEHYRELAVQRSVYQLEEADAHTFAIPRLSGRAKAALVEIQVDEYGAGARTACTRPCSPTRCARWASTTPTGPTSTRRRR